METGAKITVLVLVIVAVVAGIYHTQNGVFFSVVSVIVWLTALISLLSRRDIDIHDKVTWVVVVLLLNGLGGLIYFLFAPPSTITEERRDSMAEETQCILCKSVIPVGTDRCPKCGWTYHD